MPHWLIKAALQKAVSLMPMSQTLNNILQTRVTGTTRRLTPQVFEMKVAQGWRHLQYYITRSPAGSPPADVLELGTGWYPIIPTAIFLCGADRVWTVDRSNMVRRDRVLEMLGLFLDYARDGRLAALLPGLRPERIAQLERASASSADNPSDILRTLNIEYMPADARHLSLPAACVDFIYSNLVIGFIPAEILAGILVEFRRVIRISPRPTALMCHYVDLSDLYAYFDRNITVFNFLRYSPGAWRLLNNNVAYLNRLRISDYRRLHQDAGFTVVHEDNVSGSQADLARVPLAAEFRGNPPADLAVTSSWIISQPRA